MVLRVVWLVIGCFILLFGNKSLWLLHSPFSPCLIGIRFLVHWLSEKWLRIWVFGWLRLHSSGFFIFIKLLQMYAKAFSMWLGVIVWISVLVAIIAVAVLVSEVVINWRRVHLVLAATAHSSWLLLSVLLLLVVGIITYIVRAVSEVFTKLLVVFETFLGKRDLSLVILLVLVIVVILSLKLTRLLSATSVGMLRFLVIWLLSLVIVCVAVNCCS